MKRKINDIVILNERFRGCENKKAKIHSMETDKKGNKYYRLTYKGKLDPWNWLDRDFK